MAGPEYLLAEKPAIEVLVGMGYSFLGEEEHEGARDGGNRVLLREEVIGAVQRLNGVSREVARKAYQDFLNVVDNEQWFGVLRGDYSRRVEEQRTAKTLQLVDFLRPERNRFVVTRQFRVEGDGQKARRPDLVVFCNGVPLVVIECKKPEAGDVKLREAFDQIKQYERDVPRLFYSNVFNVITDGRVVLYGATGAKSQYWLEWKDPWPRAAGEFGSGFEAGLWSLLEPSRLLDLMAHFVVFERDGESGAVIKKICRYQQFRAVNKIVHRVVSGEASRGLIWHTQGSGKSLTMVFAALKLKFHKTIDDSRVAALANPNLLVLTDRKSLDDQISRTFVACGLRNPKRMKSMRDLRAKVHERTLGLTVLSTIQKFEGSRSEVEGSERWIVLVDECHRTQEKDLGAYLRVTLPHARFFGFTGTPIKKTDKDTYANFGAPGEGYLDRYSIDDAVADGATVPIKYTSLKPEWQVDAESLDSQFEHWFAGESEEKVAALRAKGVSMAVLLKHEGRVRRIAKDLWQHFRGHARPDGYKAQLVAIDREAVILYKRALDEVIAESLVLGGEEAEEARAQAGVISACVYSSSQEDDKPSEDPWRDDLRRGMVEFALDEQAERAVIASFKNAGEMPEILIVCNKLLTGFDAPIEAVMYLDSPLKEHNLLQAIARTNRVAGDKKQYGLVVDYVGVTKNLKEALQSYREEDVQGAMRDLDGLRRDLAAAHGEVAAELRACFGRSGRKAGRALHEGLDKEIEAFLEHLGAEDAWFTWKRKARAFTRAYAALSPDPAVLEYTDDLKWVALFMPYGTQQFEQKESVDLTDASAKIREMLAEHLRVTGMTTLIKLRSLSDPEYWSDFEKTGTQGELKVAAIRKTTELKKILTERVEANPLRYGPFSERVMEILRKLEAGQLEAAEALAALRQVSEDLREEDRAHETSGLSARAYGVFKILEAFAPVAEAAAGRAAEAMPVYGERGGGGGLNATQRLAEEIDGLYTSEQTAPLLWHQKGQVRKALRMQVRRLVNQAGFDRSDLKPVPLKVEEYALKHYRKDG